MVTPQKSTESPGKGPAIGPVRRFGRYTLVKKLATGGMAEIWLARQRGLAGFNRFVVIKKILSHLSEQETFVKMFLDEARTSAQLNHPNVVQIYDLGREGDSYYIAMEFIAGENLAAIAWRGMKREKPFPPPFAARVIADACKALHYAHHLKGSDGSPLEIVHRDISPQNILVTYEGEVKVVDFGIAKARTKSEHTKTGMLKGKFSYMSPEQCLGAPVDMRSDIFALGILLYELCTGKRLFKHESELMILEMITKRSVVSPSQVTPGISNALEDIIMRALEKDVNLRFQTSQDMQQALEAALQDSRNVSNADISIYMRDLFHDKIEEKRRLREIASREDFESMFGADDEATEQAIPPGGGKRRTVHGLSPNQIQVRPGPGGTSAGPMIPPGHAHPTGAMGMHPGHSMPNMPHPAMGSHVGSMIPGQTPVGHMPYPANGSMVGAVPHGGYSTAGYPVGYVDPNAMPQEGNTWITRLVILGALIVILVASAILYQQLTQDPDPLPEQIAQETTVVAPSSKTGMITLESSPSGAEIFLDGKPMLLPGGKSARTPSDLHSLQYGVGYKIRLQKSGYRTFEKSFSMGPETDKSKIRAELDAFDGKLMVEVTGPKKRDTRILINGEDKGLGPKLTLTLKGNTTVRVTGKLPGYRCREQNARIEPNQTATQKVNCYKPRAAPPPTRTPRTNGGNGTRTSKPPPARVSGGGGCVTDPNLPFGYVTINTKPYANIYWNGRKIGETPISKHKMPAGCIRLRAVDPKTNKSKDFKVTVQPNTVQIFDISF